MINKCLASLSNHKMDPFEDTGDTGEQVLFELDLMKIENLQLMAWQNELSTEGDRNSLINRIRESFGFGFLSKTDANEEDKQKFSSASIASTSSLSTPSSATPAATGTKSAESLPGFVENLSNLEIPDEDIGLEEISRLKRKEPLLDLSLEAGETEETSSSGKVSIL